MIPRTVSDAWIKWLASIKPAEHPDHEDAFKAGWEAGWEAAGMELTP